MELYKKIRSYRQSKGITQTFIASETNMSVKTINAIELGRKRLLADEFETICRDGLKVNPQIFFTDNILETKKKVISNQQPTLPRTG